MPTPPPFHPDRRRRGPEEQEAYEALAVFSSGERFEVLRDMALARSVKLGGASAIMRRARQVGVLGDVLDALGAYRRP